MILTSTVNGDSGESGLQGWTIRLKGRDSCTNTVINGTAITNATGYFEFRNITAGTYLLSEVIPVGWLPTTPAIYKVIVPPYSTVRKDFGNVYYP